MRAAIAVALALGTFAGLAAQPPATREETSYLTWSASEAEAVGERAYRRGRVGGFFDGRLLKTERAYNYKLAATLLTPDVIRASARLQQLRSRLSPDETRALVAEGEAVAGTVVMVEIDPREGSGVIPLEWQAFLQALDRPESAVRGANTPELRTVKALSGVRRRNYDYDRFWMVFPTTHVSGRDVRGVELIVRIHDKEGRVEWTLH